MKQKAEIYALNFHQGNAQHMEICKQQQAHNNKTITVQKVQQKYTPAHRTHSTRPNWEFR